MRDIALRYPAAIDVQPPLPTAGRYAKGYPLGAVIHYTAGSYSLSELALAREAGYVYMLIDEHGGVHQGFPLDRWGAHAGKSSWPSLGSNVSQHLVGIEVDCAGMLREDRDGKIKSWWGKEIAHEHTRRQLKMHRNIVPGIYHRFTRAQEASLTELLLWMHSNNPEVFSLDLVLGHDEVSPGRKWDPGASLSMTMPEYRLMLKARAHHRDARSV